MDRRPDFFRPSRALIVHPRTLEGLRPLGVTDALLAHGDVAPSVHLHLGRREIPVQLGGFALADTAFPYLLFERQSVLEAVLSNALADRGVEVERGVELVDARLNGDGVEADVRTGRVVEQVACRFVAACDGSASTVRRLAGVGWRGGDYRQEVVLADLELDGGLAPDVAHVVVGPKGLLFVFALGEGATWRMLATQARTSAQAGIPEPDAELQTLLDVSGLPARVNSVAWSSRVALQHRMASRYRCGPLFLVGDAAHVHSPAGGQGMNTGIQDAMNLGWKLAFATSGARSLRASTDPLLDSYEQERRPVARQVLTMTHALFWAEAATSPVPSFVRRVLAPLASPLVPGVLGLRRPAAEVIRVLSQLRVHYRHSPLSVDAGPPGRRGPRPGERLPDGSVTVAGARCRRHDLTAVPGVHVFLDAAADHLDATALGPMVHVHRIVDRPGAGVLVVRPDGYVGFRAATVDTSQVESWMTLVGANFGAATASAA